MLLLSEMQKLNFPEYQFNLKRINDQVCIQDVIRKKYLVLTPEEWVRQHIITYLKEEKNYPQSLFSVESGIQVNTLKKRYDVLVFSRTGKPLVLIECKAPEVPINQKVFEQIVIYNSKVSAPYMLVTNGISHFFLRINSDSRKFVFEQNLPEFSELTEPE